MPVKSISVQYSDDQSKGRPFAQTTIDEEEREKFTKLSHTWWDELGEFKALHSMNAIRIPWIRDTLTRKSEHVPLSLASPLQDKVILDAGSGGGILTEVIQSLVYIFCNFFKWINITSKSKTGGKHNNRTRNN